MGILLPAPRPRSAHTEGLRWKGSNITALATLTNSGALTISDDPALPLNWQTQAFIYYDATTTNTFVGIYGSSISRYKGTIFILR